MRLSEWHTRAPVKEAVNPKVVALVRSALDTLGADADPECWIAWGDEPSVRYLMFVPTVSGLIQMSVRVSVPGEGPRASAKVIRWNRVQLGELAIEMQGGHRLVTFQAEAQVLSGADDTADGIAAFAQALFAAVDGRAGAFAAPPARAGRAVKAAATTSRATAKATPAKRLPATGT